MATTSPVVKTLISGNNKLVVNITAVYDGTNQIDGSEVQIDRSALTGPDGVSVPTSIRVDEITWSVSPNTENITLWWKEAAGDIVIERLSGQGYMDYRPYGGKVNTTAPGVAGDGDIFITSTGMTADDTVSILLACTLKQ